MIGKQSLFILDALKRKAGELLDTGRICGFITIPNLEKLTNLLLTGKIKDILLLELYDKEAQLLDNKTLLVDKTAVLEIKVQVEHILRKHE